MWTWRWFRNANIFCSLRNPWRFLPKVHSYGRISPLAMSWAHIVLFIWNLDQGIPCASLVIVANILQDILENCSITHILIFDMRFRFLSMLIGAHSPWIYIYLWPVQSADLLFTSGTRYKIHFTISSIGYYVKDTKPHASMRSRFLFIYHWNLFCSVTPGPTH